MVARSVRVFERSDTYTNTIVNVHVCAFDLHTCYLDSYPQGWLRTVAHFQRTLYAEQRRNVRSIHIGAEHTVICDELSNVYTFGNGDEGQLGHGNRRSLATPHLMETLVNAAGAPEAQSPPLMRRYIHDLHDMT